MTAGLWLIHEHGGFNMETTRLVAVLSVVGLAAVGCGVEPADPGATTAAVPSVGEAVAKKEQAFTLFDGVERWFIGKIQAAPNKNIRVCMYGTGITSQNRTQREIIVRDAIMQWVDAVRPTSTVPLIASSDIVFSCPGIPVDIAIDWSATPASLTDGSENPGGVAYVGGSGITLFEGNSPQVVLHELGHVFGLSDTYQQQFSWPWDSRNPVPCKPGQPNSVMCGSGGIPEALFPDDVRAVREAYAVAFNTQSTLRWYGDLQWCTTSANMLTIGDFNGDGRSDMLCHKTTGEKWVNLAQADGTFGGGSWYGDLHWCGASTNQLLIGKFNDDNRSDMMCHNTTTGEKWILYATPEGGFDLGSAWYSSLPWCRAATNRMFVGHFNTDGRDDMLCHDTQSGAVWVALSDVDGQFSGTTHFQDLGFCVGVNQEVRVGDFDGDGRSDLLCHDRGNGRKWVLKSNSSGTFEATSTLADIGWCTNLSDQLLVGDFGGSTAADLLCHASSGKKYMALSSGGTFSGTSREWHMQWCYGLSNRLLSGDFNGDGVSDMLCHDVDSGRKWISFQGR